VRSPSDADGANVEIREEAGPENFFLFGLTADAVERARRDGYRPADFVAGNPELRVALELIGSGYFSAATPRCSGR